MPPKKTPREKGIEAAYKANQQTKPFRRGTTDPKIHQKYTPRQVQTGDPKDVGYKQVQKPEDRPHQGRSEVRLQTVDTRAIRPHTALDAYIHPYPPPPITFGIPQGAHLYIEPRTAEVSASVARTDFGARR